MVIDDAIGRGHVVTRRRRSRVIEIQMMLIGFVRGRRVWRRIVDVRVDVSGHVTRQRRRTSHKTITHATFESEDFKNENNRKVFLKMSTEKKTEIKLSRSVSLTIFHFH